MPTAITNQPRQGFLDGASVRNTRQRIGARVARREGTRFWLRTNSTSNAPAASANALRKIHGSTRLLELIASKSVERDTTSTSRHGVPVVLALARLPLQIPLIWWAWRVRVRAGR